MTARGLTTSVICVATAAITFVGCTGYPPSREEPVWQESKTDQAAQPNPESRQEERRIMVEDQLVTRDIVNPRVLQIMSEIPRHKFVPEDQLPNAYADRPLEIGHGQTISQPYIVALMTQLGDPQPGHKALDVGTGSGYQAAVLSELVDQVYSIEIVESLADEARARLEQMGYGNIQVRHGDGYHGWPEEAPFDLIVVAAAPDHVPPALVEQLAKGGKLIIPVGDRWQQLLLIEKDAEGNVTRSTVAPVTFVPMTGDAIK